MAQLAVEDTIQTSNDSTPQNDVDSEEQYLVSPLTEEELKNQVKELNDLMDPSQLTTTQQHCIAQIVACFITNHIHRYYHCHKFVASINNELNNLNMLEQKPQNNDEENEEKNEEENSEDSNLIDDVEFIGDNAPKKDKRESGIHLIYPIPILKPLPKSLFLDDEQSNEQEQKEDEPLIEKDSPQNDENDIQSEEKLNDETGFSMSSIIKKPEFYCDITSTNMEWGKSLLYSFCEYLKIPKKQIIGYLHMMESVYIDPLPFFEALNWKKEEKDNMMRIPLLLLQSAISMSGKYDSRLRSLLKYIVTYLDLSWRHDFIVREYSFGVVLHVLLEKKESKSSTKSYSKWAKIGAVGILSGTLIAITGGIAAPAVAAGLGAIGLSSTAVFLVSTTGTATLYVLFGLSGAGFAGFKTYKVASDVKDFKFVSLNHRNQIKNNQNNNGLNVVIAINGWIETDEESDENEEIESCDYWQRIFSANGHINLRSDCYSLDFERDCLKKLGEGLKKFVAKRAVSGTVSTAAKATLMTTALGTLLAALTWPVALLAVADYIDNPWTLGFTKSKEAGLVLADCLSSGNHGSRPVTLIGWSLGARVIFYALKEMVKTHKNPKNDEDEEKDGGGSSKFKFRKKKKDKKKDVDLSSIIENVIILGAPCTVDEDIWKDIRSIVSDRIINCYSTKDWVLKFVYRTATATTSVAGLQPIECDGVENVNLSNCIDGHSEYYKKTPIIIKHLIDSCGIYL